MLIIDGHEDIAYNALEWGRDIRLSAYAVREREKAQGLARGMAHGVAMSGLPDLRRGGFGIVFGVIFTFPIRAAMKQDESHSQFSQFVQELAPQVLPLLEALRERRG